MLIPSVFGEEEQKQQKPVIPGCSAGPPGPPGLRGPEVRPCFKVIYHCCVPHISSCVVVSIYLSTNVSCSIWDMWAIYKIDVIFQGHSGLPGIRGPKGEKVFCEIYCCNVFCYRCMCTCVLVFISALMSPPSPLPSFVLLQGEIGRPGSKVSRSSPLTCLVLSLTSLWHVLRVLGINRILISPLFLLLLSSLCILNHCDVICLLMCLEHPLQLLNGPCYINLSSCCNHVAVLDHIPGCLLSSSCASTFCHSPSSFLLLCSFFFIFLLLPLAWLH